MNYATEEWIEDGIRAYGGYFNKGEEAKTDVGELCVCDDAYRLADELDDVPDSVDLAVRFKMFPAREVCRIFHRRQLLFCAYLKYTQRCVDKMEEAGIEPPSEKL